MPRSLLSLIYDGGYYYIIYSQACSFDPLLSVLLMAGSLNNLYLSLDYKYALSLFPFFFFFPSSFLSLLPLMGPFKIHDWASSF